jgi:hypothetical protein
MKIEKIYEIFIFLELFSKNFTNFKFQLLIFSKISSEYLISLHSL